MALQKHSGFQLQGDIDANSHKIQNLPAPVDDNDAVRYEIIKALLQPWNDEGLVLYLPFNENQGQIAKDFSHYGNHGKFKGAGEPAWCEGRRGPAVNFDGNDDYMDCGSNASLDITNAITFEAWVKLSAIDIDQKILFKKSAYGFAVYTNNKVEIQIYDGGSAKNIRNVAGGTVLTTGQWYHLVGSYDGATLKTYVNGVLDRSFDYSGDIDTSVEKLGIGAYNVGDTPDFFFNGKIDELRIYNRALSADEIKMHYLRSQTVGMPRYISRARAYRSGSDQTIPSGTWTKVQLNAESYDEQDEFDHVTNYRFTAKKADFYVVIAKVFFWNFADQQTAQIAVRKNGSDALWNEHTIANAGNLQLYVMDVIELAAGDYLELYVYQGTGSDKSIDDNSVRTFMTIYQKS